MAEFQVVVMAAGKGSRLSDLTLTKPKCLLPIANRPMLFYPLKALENAKFEEAIVIVQEHFRQDVAALPSKYGLKIKLDLVSIPKTADDYGTADSLRFIHEKIKMDVLILTCDLVGDIPLNQVLNQHRLHECSVTALFCQIPPEIYSVPVPGPKSKMERERDLVGIDAQTSRLIFMVSEADLVSENETDPTILLSKSICKQFPEINVESDLLDAHLYVFKKWVCDYIKENESLLTLKGEVLPRIVREQFSKQKNRNIEDLPNPNVSVVSMKTENRDIYSFVGDTLSNEDTILKYSSWNDHRGDLRGPYQDQSVRCFAYVAKDGFCLRANTLSSYCELNRQITKRWAAMFPEEKVSLPEKGQVGVDCLIGETTQLSERCSIKHTVIGQSCHIGDKVKITNCIIMDHCVIEQGTSLQGCLIMDQACVESLCDIKDSIIGAKHKVHSACKATNEILLKKEHLTEY